MFLSFSFPLAGLMTLQQKWCLQRVVMKLVDMQRSIIQTYPRKSLELPRKHEIKTS